MDTMEIDPAYVAAQVKNLRKLHKLTQENLADAAGLSTRTIEKVESGRHRPDEQTLRSIARAVQLNVNYFEKPSPEQEEQRKASFERAFRKTLLRPIYPIRTASDFLSAFEVRHAYRIDTSSVANDEALSLAAAMTDLFEDYGFIWEECTQSQRLQYAREFVSLCESIEELGYVCYMGDHRQQCPQAGRPPIIFSVQLMALLPKDGPEGMRFAKIQLDGAWETLEEDRHGFL